MTQENLGSGDALKKYKKGNLWDKNCKYCFSKRKLVNYNWLVENIAFNLTVFNFTSDNPLQLTVRVGTDCAMTSLAQAYYYFITTAITIRVPANQ